MRRTAIPAIVLALFATACASQDETSQVLRNSNDRHLTVGVSFDHPGLAQKRADNTMRGFDIDVARYVASQLGVSERGITWRQVLLPDRERAVEAGEVDIVVAAYSITDVRKKRVSFAGPYFVAGQDLLVRSRDETITGPDLLDGKALCSVRGTTSAAKIRQDHSRDVKLLEYDRFEMCVRALLTEEVDAVTTDDLILAGYAARNPELLKVVGRRFSEERYGIGLRRDDTRGRDAVNTALTKMIKSGEWRAAIDRNFASSDFVTGPPPDVIEN